MPNITTLGTLSARAFGFASKILALADPFFKNVTLLLNGDTVSGASTFITDASTNNFPISPTGNVSNSGQNPFQAGYYSNYFNGSGDSLTSVTSSAYAFGTGDFTFEGWYFSLDSGSSVRCLFDNRSSATSAPAVMLRENSGGFLAFF